MYTRSRTSTQLSLIKVKDVQMSLYQESFFLRLDGFAILYVQVGQIELTLRSRIPVTLSSSSKGEVVERWYTLLKFDFESRKSIQRALKFLDRRGESIEQFLPLSFWTRLFSLHNYEKLWIPHLHRNFPNLKNPKSKRSSREIYFLMNELRRIRNHIAHYNFAIYENISRDRRNLAHLQFLLELPSS